MARRRSSRGSNLTVDCGSGDFAEIVNGYMEEHCWEVDDDVVQAAGDAGAKAARLLQERSRKRSGRYAKGWTADMEASETGIDVTVHNKKIPQLTHLLEKGHVIRNRAGGPSLGRVAGDGIIAKVADEVSGEFEGKFQ